MKTINIFFLFTLALAITHHNVIAQERGGKIGLWMDFVSDGTLRI